MMTDIIRQTLKGTALLLSIIGVLSAIVYACFALPYFGGGLLLVFILLCGWLVGSDMEANNR